MIALEYSTLSVIAPKACANILWKDSSREIEAATLLKMCASDLFELKFVDKILPEPNGGAHMAPDLMANTILKCIKEEIRSCAKVSNRKLVKRRIKKYSDIGRQFLINK